MSVENISVGWTSPFTYTFSAINSWIAEELRTIGAEWSVKRPGSQYNSPHTFTWTTAIYGFNDPVGTLLTWRGWALHNRQTPFSDRVDFANYPSVDTGIMAGQPAWVEPFREIDGNLGYYLGVRWKYLNQSDIKIYYYDNNGDGTETEPSGQYAWETEFESLAWRYRLTRKTLLLSQWMRGHTRMGIGNAAHVDYTAWYAMLSLRMRQHRFSIRYDDFKVSELDDYPADPNASDGSAWTAAWRYRIHRQLETGIEYLTLSSWNDNRSDFGWPRKETQSQVLIVFQYRFSH